MQTTVLYSYEEIQSRIKELGAQITKDYSEKYPGEDILVIGVLKGCIMAMSHLLVHLDFDLEIDFMTISSYKQGTKSEDFKLVQDLDSTVKGRRVLIVEDIIDSGRSINFAINHLKNLGAKSVDVAVLIYKTTNLQYEIEEPKYKGFHYNDKEFIIGFGFDLAGKYRNLPDIHKIIQE